MPFLPSEKRQMTRGDTNTPPPPFRLPLPQVSSRRRGLRVSSDLCQGRPRPSPMKGRTPHWALQRAEGSTSRDSPESSLPPTIHPFIQQGFLERCEQGARIAWPLPVGLRARGETRKTDRDNNCSGKGAHSWRPPEKRRWGLA